MSWRRRLAYVLLLAAVAATLAARVLPIVLAGGHGRGDGYKIKRAQNDLGSLSMAVRNFAADVGRPPHEAEGVAALLDPPAGVTEWGGPYVEPSYARIPDPWGRPYVYRSGPVDGGKGWRVQSVGPDGVEGTSDDVVASDSVP